MMTTLIAALALSTTAQAGRGGSPDLSVSVSAPASVDVADAARISVQVANNGRGDARDAALVIQLPETATSPTVHVMGDLSNIDSRCALVGTELQCALGRLRRGQSATVSVDFAAPWASVDLDIDAVASTTGEADASDNADGVTLSVAYIDQPITGPAGVTNRHCTGQGLQGFYECTLYPSSISTHDILLNADGSITFPPGITGFTGSWWQDTDDHLHFEYVQGGTTTRVVFDGNGVGGDCFEGVTTFPGSAYNAGYEVCFREL